MRINDVKYLAHTAWCLRNYLKKPLTVNQAMHDIKIRMANREQNFLNLANKSIYENQNSPYRKLLLWAGCDYADLQDGVRRQGLNKTLEKLRDEGVYITLDEFKSKVPISRKGLTVETSEADFNNPLSAGKGFQFTTSGSRSNGTDVMYSWDFIAGEAANELILYETHNLAKAPLAFWLPVLPCSSGIMNFLLNIKFRRPPDKWFSQLSADSEGVSRKNRRAESNILLCCRFLGFPAPRPEFVDIGCADKVARWMQATRKSKGVGVVRTYVSSAVRIVQAAIDKGIDISGNVIFTGAEPLTQRRAAFIKSAGVKALPRYVATETGLIGASCGNGSCPDEMHVYLDRLAIIQRPCETAVGGHKVNSFLFSTLLNNAGKILLNTDIGDFGNLTVNKCGCLFGQLGMDVCVSEVRSYDKLTCEGMTLLGSHIEDAVGEVVEEAGGCPDDFQFWETHDKIGLAKLIIAVNPRLAINEEKFIAEIMDKLNRKKLNITSQIWEQAKVLQLVRAYPKMSKGFKLLPICRLPEQS
jgi:hypothetical protein